MSDAKDANQTDYRDTLFLPKTDFPMRAGLPKVEPEWLKKWEEEGGGVERGYEAGER